jgi:hypothetical protein
MMKKTLSICDVWKGFSLTKSLKRHPIFTAYRMIDINPSLVPETSLAAGQTTAISTFLVSRTASNRFQLLQLHGLVHARRIDLQREVKAMLYLPCPGYNSSSVEPDLS